MTEEPQTVAPASGQMEDPTASREGDDDETSTEDSGRDDGEGDEVESSSENGDENGNEVGQVD